VPKDWPARGRQPTARANSFGAAGAVEAVLTVHALHDGVVPHTLNLKELDPEIDLDVVADSPRRGDYHCRVTIAFALGRNNVAVAFGAY
jgi:beta-ketoacyl ACP synthase